MTVHQIGNWILAGLLLGTACAHDQPPAAIDSAPAGAGYIAAPASDARIGPSAQEACLTGDSLLRRIPGITVTPRPAIPFDSLWHGSPGRWACHVAAIGRGSPAYAEIDSVRTWLTARGWLDRTAISADGPDGTIEGVRRAEVTCLIEGRWDGGDDADSTAARNDSMEVHLACTRLIAADTLAPI